MSKPGEFTKFIQAEYRKGYQDGKLSREFDGCSFMYYLGWREGQEDLQKTREFLRDYTKQYFKAM